MRSGRPFRAATSGYGCSRCGPAWRPSRPSRWASSGSSDGDRPVGSRCLSRTWRSRRVGSATATSASATVPAGSRRSMRWVPRSTRPRDASTTCSRGSGRSLPTPPTSYGRRLPVSGSASRPLLNSRTATSGPPSWRASPTPTAWRPPSRSCWPSPVTREPPRRRPSISRPCWTSCHPEWRERLAFQGRNLELTIEPGTPEVRASGAAVRQVLRVLVDNATTHGGGTVTVAVREATGAVAIDVSDEGAGVRQPESVLFAPPRRSAGRPRYRAGPGASPRRRRAGATRTGATLAADLHAPAPRHRQDHGEDGRPRHGRTLGPG